MEVKSVGYRSVRPGFKPLLFISTYWLVSLSFTVRWGSRKRVHCPTLSKCSVNSPGQFHWAWWTERAPLRSGLVGHDSDCPVEQTFQVSLGSPYGENTRDFQPPNHLLYHIEQVTLFLLPVVFPCKDHDTWPHVYFLGSSGSWIMKWVSLEPESLGETHK